METKMQASELKLKQASVVLGTPPKELQNLVQFQVVRPRKRGRTYWFDRNTLLQAKCALYLKQSLGASTEHLAGFVRALSEVANLGAERGTVRIQSRPRKNMPPVEILIPVGMLRRELEERLPLAAAAMDLPRGRKRPGWKDEFSRAVQEAAGELPPMSEEDIVKVVKQYRRESRVYPEIKLAAKG
jgi:hypothetical protein